MFINVNIICYFKFINKILFLNLKGNEIVIVGVCIVGILVLIFVFFFGYLLR